MSFKCFHMITRRLDRFLKNRKKSWFFALRGRAHKGLWGLYFTWLYRETFSEPKMIFFFIETFFLKNVLDSEIKIFISKSMFLNNFFLYCMRQKWILQKIATLSCCSFIFRPSSYYYFFQRKPRCSFFRWKPVYW